MFLGPAETKRRIWVGNYLNDISTLVSYLCIRWVQSDFVQGEIHHHVILRVVSCLSGLNKDCANRFIVIKKGHSPTGGGGGGACVMGKYNTWVIATSVTFLGCICICKAVWCLCACVCSTIYLYIYIYIYIYKISSCVFF